jgi:hypothetical protein
MKQPDLIPPDHAISTIVVNGIDLAQTEQRLRDLGAVVLGFSVKGATYTLRVLLPPGEMLEQILEGKR